jgi:hypothetical protein
MHNGAQAAYADRPELLRADGRSLSSGPGAGAGHHERLPHFAGQAEEQLKAGLGLCKEGHGARSSIAGLHQ